MIEFAFRLVAVAAVVFLSGWLGTPPFDLAWRIGLGYSALASLAYLLNSKKMMGAGLNSALAIIDSAAVACLLAASGLLASYGYLVLLPCAYVTLTRKSYQSAIGPVLAGTVFFVFAMFQSGSTPVSLYVLCGALGLIGSMLGRRVTLVQPRIVVPTELDQPVAASNPDDPTESDEFLAIREQFRKLKAAYGDLEKKSRRDRLSVKILEASFPTGEKFFDLLASKVMEITDADAVSVFTLAEFDDVFVRKGIAGEMHADIADHAFPMDRSLSIGRVKHGIEKQIIKRIPAGSGGYGSHMLICRSKPVAMILFRSADSGRVDEIEGILEEISASVAALIVEEVEKARIQRRLSETETLYQLATISSGATDPENLALRLMREAGDIVDADHFGIYWIEEQEPVIAASRGHLLPVFETLSFATGPGFEGWLGAGAPEMAVFETREDGRCRPAEALKRRIGGFCIVPLRVGTDLFGFMLAATHRAGGLDTSDLITLRVFGSELGQAISRVTSAGPRQEGLATPGEFQKIATGAGSIVHLEPLRKESIIDVFGVAAFERALKDLSRIIRSSLPAGGAICRRNQGDLVAYLPGIEAEDAARWANEVAASASMVTVASADGKSKAPLGVRAKAAQIEERVSLPA
ncbi:MAG: GAF domain-containing protein [Fimbriimonadaceae bacterium]